MSGRCHTLATAAICVVAGLEVAHRAHAAVSNRELVEITDIDSLGVSPDARFAVFRTEQADIG